MGLLELRRGYKGLQGLQGVTRVYNFDRRLQVVTKGYNRLQGITRGDRGLLEC